MTTAQRVSKDQRRRMIAAGMTLEQVQAAKPTITNERAMSTKTTGMVETEIYTTDDGLVAIEQPNDTIVLLSADQLLAVIKELQTCYDNRAKWQEPTRE